MCQITLLIISCISMILLWAVYSVLLWATHLFSLVFAQTQTCTPITPNSSPPNLWGINSVAYDNAIWFSDNFVLPVLQKDTYGCGFYGNKAFGFHYFAVFILLCSNNQYSDYQVVWSANNNSPIKNNSTLELKSDGNLVLKDSYGTVAWATNTSGRSVTDMKLTQSGNLVLLDKNSSVVWQSFDYPTDSLVLGQKLRVGQKLTPMVSSTNLSDLSFLSLEMTSDAGLSALVGTNPGEIYYASTGDPGFINNSSSTFISEYVQFLNGSLAFFFENTEIAHLPIPMTVNPQYMKFSSDGHLRVYEFRYNQRAEIADMLSRVVLGDCDYPMACGEYGICSEGQCTCPAPSNGLTYFQQINDTEHTFGCSAITPLSCEAVQYHSFLELVNITQAVLYEAFYNQVNVSSDHCKEMCASNCSCNVAFFELGSRYCSLQSEVFSLKDNDMNNSKYTSITAYLKVQNLHSITPSKPPSPPKEVPSNPKGDTNHLKVILGSGISSLILLLLLSIVLVRFIWKKKYAKSEDDDDLDHVPGMLTRFSYPDLKARTKGFEKKLGQGGFGSVFEGSLIDNTKIAVKCLHDVGHIKKSFLAEVKTIGSIHHVNLVRLVGYCADKSHLLLVYEFMPNGSLDKWIFHKANEFLLRWQQRKKIILDIAMGINYLHDQCRHKIIHLDIKPQNILLDENFNAKVADFGLSKLIERDQSQVVTTMRGTPGYLAPEWLSSRITEKVDVYSFGVVVLEIVCGRKVFVESLDEEDQYLLNLLRRNAGEDDRLLDMVDNYDNDAGFCGFEAVRMIKLAAWCLQSDYTKRPSMSTVVKVLDGVAAVEEDLDYHFWNPPAKVDTKAANMMNTTSTLPPSILSGPR